ncbi:butyrophilin subfamily 1 member A1-like [Fundulus heteroclitus]|uniref:butyrophilin subfamily 1 member A1-like n=1 Tax=Fundulus heteroclitus TaxID=8078 RepID=UPI00165BA649|nr:butyrophilin subfamily 1 member A1-like [Fundulus heteroclitus]
MYFCVFFVLGVLSSKGCFSANPTPEQILAFAGGNAILPCSLKTPSSDEVPTVEWSKEGLQPNVVFLYRNGFETFEMKNVAFEFRTNLFMREVTNGNVSLRISSVRLSDAGIYRCLILHVNQRRETTEVQLVVATVSDPKLSMEYDENQRVTVTCEATCWLPAPQMVIVDENENNITDSVEIRGGGTTECYTVWQRATVQSHTNRVVCRVEQPQTNQSRTTEILLSGHWLRSDFHITVISVEVTLFCLFGLFVLCIWCACSIYAERTRPRPRIVLDQELTGVTSETTPFLNPQSNADGADNTANRTIENLQKQVAHLRSENWKKDEIILKLFVKITSKNAVTRHDCPRRSRESTLDYPQYLRSSDDNMETGELPTDPVTEQGALKHSKPGNISKRNGQKHGDQNGSSRLGPGRTKPRTCRLNSSPAGLISSSSAAEASRNENNYSSPRWDSQTNPGENNHLVRRRHSLGLVPSFVSKHGYVPLPNLLEH